MRFEKKMIFKHIAVEEKEKSFSMNFDQALEITVITVLLASKEL